jgi:hypothetical protein
MDTPLGRPRRIPSPAPPFPGVYRQFRSSLLLHRRSGGIEIVWRSRHGKEGSVLYRRRAQIGGNARCRSYKSENEIYLRTSSLVRSLFDCLDRKELTFLEMKVLHECMAQAAPSYRAATNPSLASSLRHRLRRIKSLFHPPRIPPRRRIDRLFRHRSVVRSPGGFTRSGTTL